jgi:phage shock protein A
MEIAPYMVSDYNKGEKSYFQVDPSAITYMLVNAIKEQQEEIGQLEQRLADKDAAFKNLNEKVEALLKQMGKLEASMASKAEPGNEDLIGEKLVPKT